MSVKRCIDNLIWLLLVFLIASSFIFEIYTWGSYIFAATCVLIFLLSLLANDGKFYLRFTLFHSMTLIFVAFILMSSLWAINPGDAITKAYTVAMNFLSISLVYIHYSREETVYPMIKAVMWGGYVLAIYSIFYYGLEQMTEIINESLRLDNDFTNVNSIGMMAAISVVINIYDILIRKKIRILDIFMMPSIVIIAATASRKAILALIIGIFLIFVLKSSIRKKKLQPIIKIFEIILFMFIIVNYASTLPMFSEMTERMSGFFALFTGEGSVDSSTLERQAFINVGLEQFINTPLGGIGIGNPHIIAGIKTGNDTYLHNNYVELLAGGGIVGFLIFYSIYAYLIYNIIKYRNADDKLFIINITLIILVLLLDFALVSYYSKFTYVCFAIFFLNVEMLKRKTAEQKAIEGGYEKTN